MLNVIFTFLQGFGLTSKDALNCLLCADVSIVRGLLGPLLPSLCLIPSSKSKSSPVDKIVFVMIKLKKGKYLFE